MFSILILASACKVSPVPPNQVAGKLGPNPYFEVDGSAIASNRELQNYNEKDIASIETLYGKNAVAVFGEKAKDGAHVLLPTKRYARAKYHALFSSVSYEFSRILDEVKYTEDIQYILNERILENNFEGDLAAINQKSLKKITVINQTELQSKYGVNDKKVGVVLKAKALKNLYNAKKKFQTPDNSLYSACGFQGLRGGVGRKKSILTYRKSLRNPRTTPFHQPYEGIKKHHIKL